MKVVFLDRDGVINVERGDYTFKPNDFEFVPGLFDNLRVLQKEGFQFIIITNQGGIAKGLYGHEEVIYLNSVISKRFSKEGLELVDIFYSPYHSDFSKSLSRKPDSLMLEKAIAIYNVNVKKSFMIGDSKRDVDAAERVGIKGFRCKPNENIRKIVTEIALCWQELPLKIVL